MSEYLQDEDLRQLIQTKQLYIQPLLEESQIGPLSVDFRIGTEFLVSFQGREPFINASHTGLIILESISARCVLWLLTFPVTRI